MYSTTSMLRTMELILGLKPMSQFDAAARPMFNSFTAKPDLTAVQARSARRSTGTRSNQAGGARGGDWSEKLNLAKEDQADDLIFNEIIWKSVKGRDSADARPRSARRSSCRVKAKREKDDDDD